MAGGNMPWICLNVVHFLGCGHENSNVSGYSRTCADMKGNLPHNSVAIVILVKFR
jgi:hypothetical protein